MSKLKRGSQAATALLCALAGLALQSLIANVRYGGNWTALFCTGSVYAVPPELAGERIYVFPNSRGYDGQSYHYVAHDPLIRTGLWRYTDNARLRYRRILLPAVSFLLALGRQPWIDGGYIAANLLFLALGAWWLSRYLDSLGLDGRLAALFVLAPAALIALDRLTVDLAFTALCMGFALYLRLGRDRSAWLVLALACLCRETGLVLAAALCLALAWEHRFARAAKFATAIVPVAMWYRYVDSRTPSMWEQKFGQLIPFQGIVDLFLRPMAYPLGAAVNAALQWLDRLELIGLVLAMAMSVWLLRRNGFGPMEVAMVLWTVIGVCLWRSFWEDSFTGARVFTPLMIYVFLTAWPTVGWKGVIPLLMVTPRILVQVVGPLVSP